MICSLMYFTCLSELLKRNYICCKFRISDDTELIIDLLESRTRLMQKGAQLTSQIRAKALPFVRESCGNT